MNYINYLISVFAIALSAQTVHGLSSINQTHIADGGSGGGDGGSHERNKRSGIYPLNSGIGYLVAVAIPVSSVNRQRVYMAFNFEAHFGLPTAKSTISAIKMPLVGVNVDQRKRDTDDATRRAREQEFTPETNVYTRKNFYRILERHIDTYGYNGTWCILRTICETAEMPFHDYNGVFGNIFHILFTPTSSEAEHIRSIYYEAEMDGHEQSCGRYYDACNISFLDLISDVISIGLRQLV